MNITANGIEGDAASVPKRKLAKSHDVNKYLRAWRVSRNMTLQQLADKLNVGFSTVAGWEKGRRQVDLSDLSALAEVYGVHPASLLFAPEDNDPKVIEMREASELARDMEEDARKEWLAMGRFLNRK